MIAVSVVALVLAGTGSATAVPQSSQGDCRFGAAVQTYLRTTDQRDARGFNKLLHREVTGVLPGGIVFNGRTEMAEFIDAFFARTDWTQTFDLKRRTADCETGYVLFESVYAEPAAGYSQTLMIGLTWTREHGRWLVLADQNTEVS
jgi:uncharacterized protein (TIGR02246 family)